MAAGAFAAALMLLQAAPAPAAPAASVPKAAAPAPASAAAQIAEKLDVAFRTCALQLTQRDFLTAKNSKAWGSQGIQLASPPADVAGMAARLFGADGIYASVATPQGAIWIAASATVPGCKVTLSDTQWALSGRLAWTGQLRGSKAWKFDKARSGNIPGMLITRDTFVLNPDRPGGHMVLAVDGPHTIINDGKGIQLIMTVSLEAAKAP